MRTKNAQVKSNQDSVEEISVISKTLIRKLRPHIEGKPVKSHPLVLDPADYKRILSNSTEAAQKEALARAEQEKRAAAKARVERMLAIDSEKKGRGEPSELDLEHAEKTKELLSKAQKQLEEDEDEIKRMNELILHAKCMLIRDAQISEKKIIHDAEKSESQRIDALMEAERVRDIERVHEREVKRRQQMRDGVAIVQKQIEERREAAILEAERKEQEAQQFLKTIHEYQSKEQEKKVSKMKQQKELLLEVKKANEINALRKKEEKEKAREEDQKIMQYLLEKGKQEEERDREEKAKKAEKDKELSRLRVMQQKLNDKRAEQDALTAKRAMEAYERAARQKEKEAAIKRAEREEQLRIARLRQQQDREHVLAIEAMNTKKEFYEILRKQQAEEAKVKQEELAKREKLHHYANEIKDQMHTHEVQNKKARDALIKDGQKTVKAREDHKKHINEIKERKLQELAGLGVPEKYCNEIRRKMKHLEKEKISNQPTVRTSKESKAEAGK